MTADRCDYCGRRLADDRLSLTAQGSTVTVHGDRRACRNGGRLAVGLAGLSRALTVEQLGSALIGWDGISWPWWLRWMGSDRLWRMRDVIVHAVTGAAVHAGSVGSTLAASAGRGDQS